MKNLYKQKNSILYFFVFIILSSLFLGVFLWQEHSRAAAERLTCENGEIRIVTVGTYTDASGTEFSSSADLTLSADGGATCTFVLNQLGTDGQVNLDSLVIDTGVTLTHPTSSVTSTYKIDLSINNTFTLTGDINVTGKGFLGGQQGENSSNTAYGVGNTLDTGAFSGQGGSHGGRGSNDGSSTSTFEYDSIINPRLPGGGGAAINAVNPGGNGGGVVRIVTGGLVGGGQILASGGSVTGSGAGGAGGSVYITAGGSDIDIFAIDVTGGNSNTGEAGGGGRVSLVNYNSYSGTNIAYGGSSNTANVGSAGTIYMRDSGQTYGILTINNEGQQAAYATGLPVNISPSDAIQEYGGAYVFDSILLSNYGLLYIPVALDPNGTGVPSQQRKLYASGCSFDNDNLSNGELQYNFIAGSGGENADYTCVAPERVVAYEVSTSSASEMFTSRRVVLSLAGPTSENVTVNLVVTSTGSTATASSDYSTSTASVTIPSGQTTSSYTFTVVDDSSQESSENVVFEMQSPLNAVLTESVLHTATLIDNDNVIISETEATTTVSEGGVSDTYAIMLGSQPESDVTITLSVTDNTFLFESNDITLSTTSLIFTPTNWDTAAVVTVEAVDDLDNEGNFLYGVLHTVSSEDVNFNGGDFGLEVGVIDNDGPAVDVTHTSSTTQVNESGSTTDIFNVVLHTQPTDNVTVTFTPALAGEFTFSTSSIVFTPLNWDTVQHITVTAVDDNEQEGEGSLPVTFSAISSDVDYDGISITGISIIVIDNDTAGVEATVAGDVSELGATTTISVTLRTQPTDDVVLYEFGVDSTEGSLSTSTLTFTPDNWDTPQVLILTGVDDNIDDGDVNFTAFYPLASSTDDNYSGNRYGIFAATNIDNDTAGITVSAISGDTTEDGGIATFTVVLDSEPSSTVSIALSASDESEGTLSTTTLTFPTSTWDTVRTVTVTGVDDGTVDGNIAYSVVLSPAVSDDTNYDGINPSDLSLNNTDNDSSGGARGGGGGGGSVIRKNTSSNGTLLYTVEIEQGKEKVASPQVQLSLKGNNIHKIAVSNDAKFEGARFVPFAASLPWELSPGLGKKTVYVKFQTRSGFIYEASDTIERVQNTAPSLTTPTVPTPSTPPQPDVFVGCKLEPNIAYKTKSSPKVYMVFEKENTKNCFKTYLPTPLYYLSYFHSWGEIRVVEESDLSSIIEGTDPLVLGPRFIPYNGSIVRSLADPSSYYILQGKKYLIENTQAFFHMGFEESWIQIVNSDVLDSFQKAQTLTASSHWPNGIVIRFTNIPARAYEVIETTSENKVKVKDLGLWEKLDDTFYRRDRIIVLTKNNNVILPSEAIGPRVTINRFLTIGSVGQDVRYLQKKLQSLGYFTYEATTGRYGYETAKAVERFQKDHGIEPKGYVGPASRDLINSL